MYELIQAGERTYYIDCPAKIGIYVKPDNKAIIIDTGNDKDAGKKILKILAAQGWEADFIINTHSHADHTGGNRLIQSRTGCAAYSSPIECDFINHTVLEPSCLYGGYPFKALRNKFLMAEPSDAKDIADAPLPEGMEIIPLKGHFFDMIGIRTPDDVVFIADCLSGEEIIKKYHIAFLYDVAEYIKTLETVGNLSAKYFIPAHAQPGPDMEELCRMNRDKVLEIAERVFGMCDGLTSPDEMLKKLMDSYGLELNYNQYVLIGSTMRSYLSYLADQGKIVPEIRDNGLYWKAV